MNSYSRSETRTSITAQARDIAAKVMAELTQLRAFYDMPSASMVEKLVEEFVMLVGDKYLSKVQYGFKRSGLIVFQLEYTSTSGGGANDNPGRIPATLNLAGASWFSYLTPNSNWDKLTAAEKATYEARLPLQRTGAAAPTLANGVYFSNARTFSTEELGVQRRVFQ